jgi:hypothetical protein
VAGCPYRCWGLKLRASTPRFFPAPQHAFTGRLLITGDRLRARALQGEEFLELIVPVDRFQVLHLGRVRADRASAGSSPAFTRTKQSIRSSGISAISVGRPQSGSARRLDATISSGTPACEHDSSTRIPHAGQASTARVSRGSAVTWSEAGR